jgi:hypothetical protein
MVPTLFVVWHRSDNHPMFNVRETEAFINTPSLDSGLAFETVKRTVRKSLLFSPFVNVLSRDA